MKKFESINRAHKVLGFLILIASLLTGVFPVQALMGQFQEARTETFTLEDFEILNDQNFQGVQVDRTFNLALPGDWTFPSEATLSIRFSHSLALNPISSMNVRWNDNFVGSTRLTDDNAENGLLEITLPPESLNAGFNALQINFFMGIAEDFCIDFDNPAVWAVVHNNTSIELSYEREAQDSELNLAPQILIDSSFLADNTITFVTSSNPALEIAQSLARMSAKMGRMAQWRNTNISAITMDEIREAEPTGDLVVIATLDQIDELFSELSDQIRSELDNSPLDQANITSDDGLIFFQPSPFDPTSKTLVLTGESIAAVEKSVFAATLDSFYEGANGPWSIVRSVPNPPDVPGSGALRISLDDLGIDTQTVFRTREQTLQFTLPLSALWNVNTEAWLELHFAHSELLNNEQSILSVTLNDIPVASIPLTAETADDGFKEIRLPLRYFNIGDNNITLRANLEHHSSREDYRNFCTDEAYPRTWLTIHSDTAVVLPEQPERVVLNLNSFPFGFANVYSYKDFAFFLGTEFSDEALKAMSDIAVSMGKALRGHPAGINVQDADTLNESQEVKYHMVIGISENLPLEALNENLPIPLNLQTGKPQSKQTMLEIDTPSEIHGIIEAFRDDQNNTFLLLTAKNPEALVAGGSLLSNPAMRTSLNGNLAVFTAPDQAMSFQVAPGQEASKPGLTPPPEETQSLRFTGQPVWIIRISIGLAVLSVILLVIALIWKDRNEGESRGQT